MSCIEVYRYGGTDLTIGRRLAELGHADLCDHPLEGHPVVLRNRVRFALADDVERRFHGGVDVGRSARVGRTTSFVIWLTTSTFGGSRESNKWPTRRRPGKRNVVEASRPVPPPPARKSDVGRRTSAVASYFLWRWMLPPFGKVNVTSRRAPRAAA